MKPAGSKRTALNTWFAGPAGPLTLFQNRILPFDDRAALIWARLMVDGSVAGRPKNPLDTIIASIAEANECVVVTANQRHFAGLNTINPLRS
jgi:predicted nucleic acid-binding protein